MGNRWLRAGLATAGIFLGSQACAQWAVVDVGAIAQLVQQVATLRDQLETARDQLQQSREALESMRGGRGMERLLSDVERDYLPSNWGEMERTLLQSTSRYRRIANELQRILRANEVLTEERISGWSFEQRERFMESRRSAATLQVMSRQALESTSERFASIEQLVRSIGSASDQKAILDLNARIAAEQAMLQNEQTKLAMIFEVIRAEEAARKQRVFEMAIEGIGSFRTLPNLPL